MKLLKKRGVAVIITVVVILLMALWGIHKAPAQLPPVQTGQWVYDGADVFSAEEEQYLTQGNAGLLSDHGAVVAIASVADANGWDLWDFCMELADKWGLNGSDMILVLDIGGDNYWLVQGYDLVSSFSDDDAYQYTRQFLENDFAAKNYGAGTVKLFDALRAWYGNSAGPLPQYSADSAPVSFENGGPVRTGGVGFGGIVLLILLIIILVIVADAMRYSSYRRRWYGVTPTVVYRPLIFGRPRRRRPPPPPPRGPRPPSGGPGPGPGPGGTRRPPTGGFGSGPRPGGTTRPPTGGSFGGGRAGGSSFGGGRTGSSGGGRSGSSFGGGRTGSFGGGRSGGSFGGGRSGSFGGGRSGGSFGGGRSGGGRR